MANLAETTIEKLSAEQYQGDLVLAYLYNEASAVAGRLKLAMHRQFAPSEGSLRHDIKVVLARPEYAGDDNLAALLTH